MTHVLGVDIGGSGVKGAVVDVATGDLVTKRHRIPTPQPATPDRVAETVATIATHFDWTGVVGCGLPAIVRDGVARSAANIDAAWVGTDAVAAIRAATGLPTIVINDADAAGLAEMRCGAGKGRDGVVLVLTFGSGIGSAIFLDGRLAPNSELGHVQFHGMDAEHYAAARLVEKDGMALEVWAKRVGEFLEHLEMIFSPALFIFGGGISKRFESFEGVFDLGVPIVPAEMRNRAGIVGAAFAAHDVVGSEQ